MKDYYVIVDCDPGVDDAMALMNLLNSKNIEVKLISVVSGNLSIDTTLKNALHLMELFKRPGIPVSKGASKPLKRQSTYSGLTHGVQGLGGYTFSKVSLRPFVLGSPDSIYYFLQQNQAKNTTLLCLGPMTNIATLLKKYPESKNMISRIVFVGGSKDENGTTIPYKEFNVSFDPEATEIVLNSHIPLVMIPCELGHIAYFDHEEQEKIRRANFLGKIFYKMFTKYYDFHVGKLGAAVHDSCAALYLSNPELFTLELAKVEVKYQKDKDGNYGYLKCDFSSKEPNAKVCVDVDIEKFKKIIYGNLFNYN